MSVDGTHTALILGARNLGGVIARRLIERGDEVATVSLSEETASMVRESLPVAVALTGDAGDPDRLQELLTRVEERLGPPDVLINAVSPPGGGPRGGKLIDAPADALDRYADHLLPAVLQFFRVGGRYLAERGAGTMIQVTGGSARRSIAGRGPWAAAAHATRALTEVASLELRKRGVHVALLIIDARIARGDEIAEIRDSGDDAALDEDILPAVELLIDQPRRAWTHELVVTPRGDNWRP